MSGGKGKGGKGKSTASSRAQTSHSKRAGLNFPVGRIKRFLKHNVRHRTRVSSKAAIYLAAVMEYLTAELLDLAGIAAKQLNVKRITPRHLQLAIRGDEELDQLVKATISGGGVMPTISKNRMLKVEVDKQKKRTKKTPKA